MKIERPIEMERILREQWENEETLEELQDVIDRNYAAAQLAAFYDDKREQDILTMDRDVQWQKRQLKLIGGNIDE